MLLRMARRSRIDRVVDLVLYPGHGRRAPCADNPTHRSIALEEARIEAARGFRGALLLRVCHAEAPGPDGVSAPTPLRAWSAVVDVPSGALLCPPVNQ